MVPPTYEGNYDRHAVRIGGDVARAQPAGFANRDGAPPDARMGDEDVVEALSGSGGQQGRVVEALRRQPTDDPPLDLSVSTEQRFPIPGADLGG